MSKKDDEFISLTPKEYYELNDWLERNNYHKTHDNRIKLKDIIINKIKENDTSKNVKWSQLDDYHEDNPKDFSELD